MKKYTVEGLEEQARECLEFARVLRGAREAVEAAAQPTDETEIKKAVKQAYIYMQNATTAARWALESIAGFATSFTRAQSKVNQILDGETCGDETLDRYCERIRKENREAARKWH